MNLRNIQQQVDEEYHIMRRVIITAMGGTTGIHKLDEKLYILIGNLERKNPPGKLRHKWEDNNKNVS